MSSRISDLYLKRQERSVRRSKSAEFEMIDKPKLPFTGNISNFANQHKINTILDLLFLYTCGTQILKQQLSPQEKNAIYWMNKWMNLLRTCKQ